MFHFAGLKSPWTMILALPWTRTWQELIQRTLLYHSYIRTYVLAKHYYQQLRQNIFNRALELWWWSKNCYLIGYFGAVRLLFSYRLWFVKYELRMNITVVPSINHNIFKCLGCTGGFWRSKSFSEGSPKLGFDLNWLKYLDWPTQFPDLSQLQRMYVSLLA